MGSQKGHPYLDPSFNPHWGPDRRSYSSAETQPFQEAYGSAADNSLFGRPSLNTYSPRGSQASEDKYRSDHSYHPTGRGASRNSHKSADSLSLDRYQFNLYGSTGRSNSQNKYKSAYSSSFDRSQFHPYSSTGTSQNKYKSADSSSFDISQFNANDSKGRRASQNNYKSADSSSFDRYRYQLNPNDFNERGASQNNYKSADSLLFDRSQFNPNDSKGRGASQNNYKSADSSSFDRSQFNPNDSKGRGVSQNNYKSADSSFFDRSQFHPYSSTGRGPSQNNYKFADSSSFDRSQFHPYSSTETSQNNYKSADSLSFDRSQFHSYSSTGRSPLQNNYKSADSSSFDRSQFHPYDSTGRGASQNNYKSADRLSFDRSQFNPNDFKGIGASQNNYKSADSSSFDRSQFNPYERRGGYNKPQHSDLFNLEINHSRDLQSYNSNRGLPQTFRFERDDYNSAGVESVHSSKESHMAKHNSFEGPVDRENYGDVIDQFHSSKEYTVKPKNTSRNHNECEDSDDDDDNSSIGDLNSDENLNKYIDKLLSAKQSSLQEAIEKYNALVSKYDASGRVFSDPDDRRMYLHWRRSIKMLSGVLKWDITQRPPKHFKLAWFLIDGTQLLGQKNTLPSGRPGQKRKKYNSGLPDPTPGPYLKKGKKMQLQQRLAAKKTFELESSALKKLQGDTELKRELFGDLAKAHFEAKAKGKKFDARLIKKRIRRKLKIIGA